MAEVWREIPGSPGYEVSSYGRVRSRRFGTLWSVLSPASNTHGYMRVSLSKGGRAHGRLVHRLVLEAFVGPCPPNMEARHVHDNDRSNNRLSNLAWGTRLENAADRARHGTNACGDRSGARLHPERMSRGDAHYARRVPGCRAGSRNGRAILSEHSVRQLRAEWSASDKRKGEQTRIARMFGVSHAVATQVINRKTWRHVAE